MILAGDVGGTKIQLARFERLDGRLEKTSERMLRTWETPSLPDALAEFAGGEPVEACGLGVAGAVVRGHVRPVNIPWEIDGAEIRARLGVPVVLLNDLVASAHGVEDVRPEDLVLLQDGEEVEGANRALVSPGTGLGETTLLRAGGAWHAVASEGGHADFAPRCDEEWELCRWLFRLFGRASVERVVSGPGLVNVFCFLRDTGRLPDDSGVAAAPGESAPAAAIAGAALEGASLLCVEALGRWMEAFGAVAGDAALRGMALGGVWLGGGIPARVLPALPEGGFLEAFRAKEPHRGMLERVPVRVILDPETTLKGAARVAAERAG